MQMVGRSEWLLQWTEHAFLIEESHRHWSPKSGNPEWSGSTMAVASGNRRQKRSSVATS